MAGSKPPEVVVKPMADEGWMSFAEAAERLGLERWSIHRMAWVTGELPLDAIRSTDNDKMFFVAVKAIEELADTRVRVGKAMEGADDVVTARRALLAFRDAIRAWGVKKGLVGAYGRLDFLFEEYDKAQKWSVGTTANRLRELNDAHTAAKAKMEEIRGWARDNGFEVSEKGYLPARVKAAYYEAQANTRESEPRKRTAKRAVRA